MPELSQRHLDGLKHHPDKKVSSRSERGLKLVLGIKPSKTKSWVLTYYLDGKKQRYAFGRYSSTETDHTGTYTLKTARIERDRLKALVRQGICPRELVAEQAMERRVAKLSRVTMGALRQRFDTEYLQRNNRKSSAEVIRTLSDKFGQWDALEVKSVNRLMITERLDEIEKSAPVMRNRAHSYLRKMLSFAVEKSIVDENYAKNISQAAEVPKTRCLNADEIRYFWTQVDKQSLSPTTVIALRLILVTGQRGGEVLSIQRSHINGNWWTQPDTKNGRAHRTFLTPTAMALIDEAAELSNDEAYLFPSRNGHMQTATLSKAIKRWAEREAEPMQIPAFTPHDLRRTMASNLGNMEVTRFDQNQILNHKDTSISAVYDVSEYDRPKQRAMNKWESRLTSIINDRQERNVIPLRG